MIFHNNLYPRIQDVCVAATGLPQVCMRLCLLGAIGNTYPHTIFYIDVEELEAAVLGRTALIQANWLVFEVELQQHLYWVQFRTLTRPLPQFFSFQQFRCGLTLFWIIVVQHNPSYSVSELNKRVLSELTEHVFFIKSRSDSGIGGGD